MGGHQEKIRGVVCRLGKGACRQRGRGEGVQAQEPGWRPADTVSHSTMGLLTALLPAGRRDGLPKPGGGRQAEQV